MLNSDTWQGWAGAIDGWGGAVTVVYDGQSMDPSVAPSSAMAMVYVRVDDVPPGSPGPVLPSDTVPAPPGASDVDGGSAAPVPTPTPPVDATTSVSPGSCAPAPPVPPGNSAPVQPCDPAPVPPPASGVPGVPHLLPIRLDAHIPHRVTPADNTLVAVSTPGAPGTAQGNADTDDGAGAAATAVTMEQGGVADALHHDGTDDDAAPADDTVVFVSPGSRAPAPPAPRDSDHASPADGTAASVLPDSYALALPVPPSTGDAADAALADGAAASVSPGHCAPPPPVLPDNPAPVSPCDPALAPPPASVVPSVPHLFRRRFDAHIPTGSTLVTAGTPGAPDTDQGNADTNDGAGATATAVTMAQGGIPDTLDHDDANGNAAPADAASLGGTLGAPLIGALVTPPHVAPLAPLTDDMEAAAGAAVLPATPNDPPAPGHESILENTVTTTAATWAVATTALALQISPPELPLLPLGDEDAHGGAALSRSSHAHASAWSTTIILSASVALFAPAIPSAFFAQPSHSSHVTHSNSGRSCCLCVAALACLATRMGLAEHASPRAAGGAPLLAQLPRQQASPPARSAQCDPRVCAPRSAQCRLISATHVGAVSALTPSLAGILLASASVASAASTPLARDTPQPATQRFGHGMISHRILPVQNGYCSQNRHTPTQNRIQQQMDGSRYFAEVKCNNSLYFAEVKCELIIPYITPPRANPSFPNAP